MWNQVLDFALRKPAAQWESEKIGFKLATDYCRSRKRRRRALPAEDMSGTEGPVLHHLCWADDLYAMAGSMEHLIRILTDMTNAIEELDMRWKEKSLKIVAGPYTEYRPGHTIEIMSKRDKKYTWHVTEGMEALGTWLDSRGCSETSMWHRISKGNSLFYAKKALFCDPKIPVCKRISAFYSTCVPTVLHGAGEWAFTQSMFQSLRSWELGKLRRVLCLRRRPNEGWVDYMKRTGLIAAKQLKKYKQLRIQELAMKRVKIAAWQMASCPDDAKGRRYWEEIVTWRCDKNWKEDYVKLSKEDYSNSLQWKRPQTGRCTYWELPFARFFGDDWMHKLKKCKTWTEWISLTKDFERAWHSMLNLKYTSDLVKGTDSFAIHEKRPREDSHPWNVAWPSDSHRRLEILGDSKVVVNWMNGEWEVKGSEHTLHVRNVIDQFVRWYLGGIFRPRNDESCWCRHVFRESNKTADTHANWLLDKGDSNPGAQWKRRDYCEKLKLAKHVVLSFDGARRGNGNGAAAWILWIRNLKGEFERIAHGGKLLRNTTAMEAEREALRLGVENLTILFPAEAKDFRFVVENESREKEYKVDIQSIRLLGPCTDQLKDVCVHCGISELKSKRRKIDTPTIA